MKKIFTLIAVAAMALSASAQTFRITWDEAVSFGYLESTYGSNGFVLTRTDDGVRHTIQSKNAYFGDATTQEKFAFCFQMKPKKNCLPFHFKHRYETTKICIDSSHIVHACLLWRKRR
jgi:opacity protein-like surface antigen